VMQEFKKPGEFGLKPRHSHRVEPQRRSLETRPG
jgi:hypothetical protein